MFLKRVLIELGVILTGALPWNTLGSIGKSDRK